MGSYLARLRETTMNRRSFVKGSVAAASALAASSLVGCSNRVEKEPVALETTPFPERDLVSGEWKTAACWHNCGGRCLNKVLVQDGVVVRQKTDDTHPDSWENPQQRACLRGRAQQQQVYSAERIKYPMKRKNWQPGGGENSNGQLRGVDEWERLSWDDAVALIAQETNRIYDEHGARSVYCNGYAMNGEVLGVLAMKGGYVSQNATDSYGAWKAGSLFLGTSFENSNPDFYLANDRFDMPNADTIVLYSCNPVWANAGAPSYNFMNAKKSGTNFVYVGPSYNVTAQAMDAKWIRVRPGTDTAFLLAVAYVMITEDEANPGSLIDHDFLDRCTVGFDMEHLPADAKVQECFKSYVLGEYDSQPKTPEWATEICGTPVEDIVWFAETIGCQNKVMLLHSYASGRCYGAEDLPQLFLTIGAMGGHMGKSGHACAAAYQYDAGNSGPYLVKWGATSMLNMAAYSNPVTDTIPGSYVNRSIIDGKYWNYGSLWARGAFNVTEGKWTDIDIRMIVSQNSAFFQSRIDVNKAVEAYRKVDFVLSVSYDFNPGAQYADVILPCCTQWESPAPLASGSMVAGWHNREMLILPVQICQPLYESKTDYEIGALLADALGIKAEELYMMPPAMAELVQIAGAQVLAEDGVTWETLVTITAEDLEWYSENVGPAQWELQEGKIGLREFFEKGIYQVERHSGDNYGYIGYKEFRENPEENPRPSVSGKLEIFCQSKADAYNVTGYLDEEYKPYPTYHVPVDGYEASFSDWETKTKGDYPFQMFTPHYLRRAHTTLDNAAWLREAFKNPAFVNASDASEKGIEDGDTIVVFNQYGKVLRRASVTEAIMPGCIALPHGPWPKIDHESGIDYGGNENVLTGSVDNPQPQLQGFNTVLVDYELWAEDALEFDENTPAAVLPDLGDSSSADTNNASV